MTTTIAADREIANELHSRFNLEDDTFQDKDYGWICDILARYLSPDDVFNSQDLSNWAENNGYVKEE
jgi:hypothetical protein